MGRIVLLDIIGMQQLAIERAFRGHQDVRIESVNKAILDTTGISRYIRDSMLLMVDVDHYDGKIDVLVEGIRREPVNAQVPVILLASTPRKELVLKVARYGNADILVKPFTETELFEKVLKYSPSPQWQDIQDMKPDSSVFGMESLQWNEGFCIGIQEIDDEHKGIVENFERLYKLMREGLGHEYYPELLTFLKNYVDTHFAHEEKLQRDISYVHREAHVASHDHFRKQVLQIIHEHEGKAVKNQDLIRLNLFIKEWLIHHILYEDKLIGLSMPKG